MKGLHRCETPKEAVFSALEEILDYSRGFMSEGAKIGDSGLQLTFMERRILADKLRKNVKGRAKKRLFKDKIVKADTIPEITDLLTKAVMCRE